MIIKKLIHACSNKKEIKFNISVPAKTVTTAGEVIDTSAIMSPFDLSNLTPRAMVIVTTCWNILTDLSH